MLMTDLTKLNSFRSQFVLMMRYFIIITMLLFTGIHESWSQSKIDMDSLRLANESKEEINGMYIPSNMSEAFRELISLSSESSLDKLKAAPEEVAATKLHLGLGKWIAAKWNFYEGSRFTKYLNTMGVSFPDDMIQFTIVSFHRHLNKRDLDLDERAGVYQQKRQLEHEERLKSARIISKRKRQKE